jgi:hypothetical protein
MWERLRAGPKEGEQCAAECRDRKWIAEGVKAAWRDYEAATAYFNAVTDPELIDHAIYCLEAARRRYSYFLNKARQTRLQHDSSEDVPS